MIAYVQFCSHLVLHICTQHNTCVYHCNFPGQMPRCPFQMVAGLDENALRDTFRVEFIAPDGSVESGVDGGGLFKAPGVGHGVREDHGRKL